MFLERPESQRVDLNAPAYLNCTANESMATVQWWRGNSAVMATTGRVTVDEQGSLRVASTTWSDIGVYTCIIRFGNITSNASATLNITGMYQPRDELQVYTVFYRVCEAARGCSRGGQYHQPRRGGGPVSRVSRLWISWTRVNLLEVHREWSQVSVCVHWSTKHGTVMFLFPIKSVTSEASVGSGVFVDGQGRLDLSQVDAANRTLFECVGVDAAGNTARTLIRVNSVDPEEGEGEILTEIVRNFTMSIS